jgi:hypothetical protein
MVCVYAVLVLLQFLALQRRLSLSVVFLLWQKRLPHSVFLMLAAGGSILRLSQELELASLANVLVALLAGGCMLVVGVVVSGDYRTILATLLKRLPQ